MTPKFHYLEEHVVELLTTMAKNPAFANKGLGFWLEQSVKASHHDFKVEWEKVKVPESHTLFGGSSRV